MSTVPLQPVITPNDRIGMTLCLAIIFHAIIILGVTFTAEDRITPRYDTMEIILVQQKDPEPNEDSKLLAQADLTGGGETADEVTPSTPVQPPFPDQTAKLTATSGNPPDSDLEPEAQTENTTESESKKSDPDETLTARNADAEATSQKSSTKPKRQQKKLPTASELLRNIPEIAALSARIDKKLEAKAQRPRRRFISASTKSYKYAAYMEAWRSKVERVGNLNYPDEARKRKLSGSLILDVALNPDGSISEITIRRSSGYKILDDAAIRIVHLASPFAPFPENISDETDILHITRTWQFLNNRGFQ